MSWQEVKAPQAAGAAALVTMSLSGAGERRRRRPHATVVVRDPEILALPWFVPGQHVDLLLGHSEHEGMLRIVPGTAEALKNWRGRGAGRYVVVISPTLALALKPRVPVFRAEPCDYDFGDSWIEVTLPEIAWGAPRAAIAAAPKGEPFRGIAARTGVVASAAAGGPTR